MRPLALDIGQSGNDSRIHFAEPFDTWVNRLSGSRRALSITSLA